MLYLLYGIRADDLEGARKLVERVLSVNLEAREGLFSGGEYYSYRSPAFRLKLRTNIDPDDDSEGSSGLSEPDYPRHKYLLYVDEIASDHLVVKLLQQSGGIEVLRQKKLRPD